jgi:enterochelin esterase-like enzyme
MRISFLTRLGLIAAFAFAGCSAFPIATPTLTPRTRTRPPTTIISPTLVPTRSPTIPAIDSPRVVTATVAAPLSATIAPATRPSSTSTRAPTTTPTSTPWSKPTGRSSCEDKRFRSASLNQDMSFYLYLPTGYADTQPRRRYPVLYLLAGLAGNYKEWPGYDLCDVMDDFIAQGVVQPMIVVMPSGNDNPAGGLGSYWFNHAPPPVGDGKRWGDYVWKDVVNYIDANYRTLATRESRAIGGLSAGGQAALMLGMTHPEIFRVVGAHSPSFRHADGVIPSFGDEKYFNQFDPEWLVQNTTTWKQLIIWIDDGAQDDQWGTAILDYHNLLVKLGVPHEFNLFYGFHDPPYWATHLPDYLEWYSAVLIGQ